MVLAVLIVVSIALQFRTEGSREQRGSVGWSHEATRDLGKLAINFATSMCVLVIN